MMEVQAKNLYRRDKSSTEYRAAIMPRHQRRVTLAKNRDQPYDFCCEAFSLRVYELFFLLQISVSIPIAAMAAKIDRQTTTPFLLKLYYRTGTFHRYVCQKDWSLCVIGALSYCTNLESAAFRPDSKSH